MDKLILILGFFNEYNEFFEVYENVDRDCLILIDYYTRHVYSTGNTIHLYHEIFKHFHSIGNVDTRYLDVIINDLETLEYENSRFYKALKEI
jgi:hypothetical protein